MAEHTVRGCRIFIAQDEYMLAEELRFELQDAEATIVAMVSSVEEALQRLQGDLPLDGAVLDVNLRGEQVFPVADRLVEPGIPFVFTTGYDAATIPPRFREATRCEKPIDVRKVVRAAGGGVNFPHQPLARDERGSLLAARSQ